MMPFSFGFTDSGGASGAPTSAVSSTGDFNVAGRDAKQSGDAPAVDWMQWAMLGLAFVAVIVAARK